RGINVVRSILKNRMLMLATWDYGEGSSTIGFWLGLDWRLNSLRLIYHQHAIGVAPGIVGDNIGETNNDCMQNIFGLFIEWGLRIFSIHVWYN
ncbi:hypothetical protein ACJX0J_034169, partial [Zea mays]